MALDALQNALQTNVKLYETMSHSKDIAVGMWADDPTDPGVTAVVCQGRLVDLTIPETYMQLPSQTLADLVNAVIVNAFIEWNRTRIEG